MRTVKEATRQLVEGENVRMWPCKDGVTGRVVLLGFGSRVLRLDGTARGARVSGSGGAICTTRGRVLAVPAVIRKLQKRDVCI